MYRGSCLVRSPVIGRRGGEKKGGNLMNGMATKKRKKRRKRKRKKGEYDTVGRFVSGMRTRVLRTWHDDLMVMTVIQFVRYGT